MATARLTKFDDLLAYLRENNVPHKPDPDGVELGLGNSIVYVRWEKALPYVQLIHPFIGNVPRERERDLEIALCRANATIKLPGFGYDHINHILYMRLCMQLYENGVSPATFQRQVFAVLENAKQFLPPFRDIIAGAPGDSVLDLALKYNPAQ
jgi:hypothetical protein